MLLHSLDEDGEEEEDEESQELEFAFEGEEWGGEEEKMEEEEEGGGESDEEGAFSQMVPAMGGGLDDMDDDEEEEEDDEEGDMGMEDVEEEEEEEWDFSMPSFSSSQPHRSPSLPPPLDPISRSPSIATPPSKNSPPPPANSAAERARRRYVSLLPHLSSSFESLHAPFFLTDPSPNPTSNATSYSLSSHNSLTPLPSYHNPARPLPPLLDKLNLHPTRTPTTKTTTLWERGGEDRMGGSG